jgi:hypothetical protein
MPEKRTNIDSALRSKGFKKLKNKDHDRYNLEVDGKITHIGTKMSTGSSYKTIGDNLLIQMYKQLRMNNIAELRRFVGCTYSYDAYLNDLIKNKHITSK